MGSIVVRPCWMDPIISFLRDGTLPADKFEARRLGFRSARYFLDKGKLYKKGFSSPSLLCLDENQGKFTLEEQTLKKKLEKSKGAWVDELPLVLWAYRTSFRAATGETPFSLAYGVEAVIPIEISLPTFRVDNFDEESNDVLLALATDLLEEQREISQVRAAALQQTIARYYNSKVKLIRFVKGELVLRKVFLNTKEKGVGVLGPN
ncbi:hypothetical protein UlMin_044743 [Ulmus minor]